MKQFKIAYIRVSTQLQNPMRQRLNIAAKCPEAVVVEEKYTGTTMSRPQWNKIMQSAEKGMISDIYFDEPSRMGRTSDECFKCYKHLYFDLHVSLHFIKNSHVDTAVYEAALKSCIKEEKIKSGDEAADKMISQIMQAVHEYMLTMIEKQIWYAFKEAEDEATLLSMRTKSGIGLARSRGKRIGGQKGEHYKTRAEWAAIPLILKYYKGFEGTYDIAGIARIIGATYKTTRMYIANIYKEQEIANELTKYADTRPYTRTISEIDSYKEEAEAIWRRLYKREMKWTQPVRKRKYTHIAESLATSRM